VRTRCHDTIATAALGPCSKASSARPRRKQCRVNSAPRGSRKATAAFFNKAEACLYRRPGKTCTPSPFHLLWIQQTAHSFAPSARGPRAQHPPADDTRDLASRTHSPANGRAHLLGHGPSSP
jgi:hypothetical protein